MKYIRFEVKFVNFAVRLPLDIGIVHTTEPDAELAASSPSPWWTHLHLQVCPRSVPPPNLQVGTDALLPARNDPLLESDVLVLPDKSSHIHRTA